MLKYFDKIRLNFISWGEYIMKWKNLEKAIIIGMLLSGEYLILIDVFSGSYTVEDRDFPVRQDLSFCKYESPCVHKILWPEDSAHLQPTD